MIPADLSAWRHGMGYTQRVAAQAMGVRLVTYQEWERGTRFADGRAVEIDRRTALACSAIAAGLEEWSRTAD